MLSTIAIGSDHAGFHLKVKIIEVLNNQGINTIDKGCYSEESVDYPDIAHGVCWEPEIASLAVRHNNANVLALPARFISESKALQCLHAFISSEFEGGRHERRVGKINPC
jgi:ribose 5-phosphate isomerase B